VARAALHRGLSWRSAAVLEVLPETARASRLVLDPPNWSGHRPGQHLDVRLTAPDGYTAQRSYSIASAPESPHVDLIVDRLPDGEVSPYLTDVLRAGDELEVRGPFGGWFVWQAAMGGPLQLIAGGSGVVPFLAMLDHHRAAGSDVPVRLLYSVRLLSEAIARERLTAAQPDVRVDLALTRESPPGWTGVSGRVDRTVLSRLTLPPEAEPQVFVCGPTGFVDAVADAMIDLGHPSEKIKTERFGASGGTE
jgi:ferredoxin-NADP reductase